MPKVQYVSSIISDCESLVLNRIMEITFIPQLEHSRTMRGLLN